MDELPPTITLVELLPSLQRIAFRLAPLSAGALEPDDLLQVMAIAFIEHDDRLCQQRPAYVRQHCAWAGRRACRRARLEMLRRAPEPIMLFDDAQPDPESLAVAADDRQALREWFARLTDGHGLTPAERRTVAEALDGRRSHSRSNWCQMVGSIRAKYAHPLAVA